MFAYIKNYTFQYFIVEGTPFTIDGIQYPANWLNLSTPEEKTNLGIVDVVYDTRPDDKYYWVTEKTPTYSKTKKAVVIKFSSTSKDLQQIKNNEISSINSIMNSLLSPTDYMSIKAAETGTEMPADWKLWRQSVREVGSNAKALINEAIDVEGVIGVVNNINWPHDPNYVQSTAPTVG